MAKKSRGPTPLMRAALLEWMAHGESVARALFESGNPTDAERKYFDQYVIDNARAIRAYHLLKFGIDGSATVDRAPFMKAWKGGHRA